MLRAVSDPDLAARLVQLRDQGLITKHLVGLSAVDNTSDADKPISTAVQTVLDQKLSTDSRNAPLGVAGLDSAGQLPPSLLPPLGLNNLGDVDVTAPTDQQVLAYSSSTSKWINTNASSGGGGVSGNTLTLGIDSTQDASILGAQGTGTDVTAGDLVLQAPGGTGPMGSGGIRFNVGAPSAPVSGITANIFSAANSTTLNPTNFVYLPPVSAYASISLYLFICATNTTATLTGVSVGGTLLGTVTTTRNLTVGVTVFTLWAPNVSLARESNLSIAGTFSVATSYIGGFLFVDSAHSTNRIFLAEPFSSATTSSVSVNADSLDFLFEMGMYGRTTSVTTLDTPTPSIYRKTSFLSGNGSLSSASLSGASPYAYFYAASSYALTDGTQTFTRTYSQAVSGTHIAVVFKPERPSGSSPTNFRAGMYLSPYGILQSTLALPTTSTTFIVALNSLANLVTYLTPSSSRIISIDMPSNQTSTLTRVIVLPRADLLPVGTSFFFRCIGSFGFPTISIVTLNSSVWTAGSQAGPGPLSSLLSMSSATSQTALVQLVDNSTPWGMWASTVYDTSRIGLSVG